MTEPPLLRKSEEPDIVVVSYDFNAQVEELSALENSLG